MTAGSSRFLLKFLQLLLTSDAATDVMNISDMQRGETRRKGGLIHRQVDRGGSRSMEMSPAESRSMLQEKKEAATAVEGPWRRQHTRRKRGGGKFCGEREESEERKEKLLERGKFLWLPFATLDFHNPLERSGGFTKVFLIQQMTKMAILWVCKAGDSLRAQFIYF